MKRTSIQIAAGMATVGLGSLGVYQFVSGKSGDLPTDWPQVESVAAEEPPAPLAITSSSPNLPPLIGGSTTSDLGSDGTVVRANNESAAPSWYGSGSTSVAAAPVNYESTLAPLPSDPVYGSSQQKQDVEASGASLTLPTLSSNSVGNSEAEPPQGLTTFPSETSPSTDAGYGFPSLGDVASPTASPSLPSLNNNLAIALPSSAQSPPAYTPPPGQTDSSGYADPPAYAGGNTTSYSSPPSLDIPSANVLGASGAPVGVGVPDQRSDATSYGGQGTSSTELTLRPVSESPANLEPSSPESPQTNSTEFAQPSFATETTASLENNSPYRGGSPQETQEATPSPQTLAPLVPLTSQTDSAPLSSSEGLPATRSSSSDNQLRAVTSEGSAMNLTPGISVRTSSTNSGPSMGDPNTGVLPTQTVDAAEILSQPGTRNLEGPQAPSVVVHKRAPGEVRVGKPCEFVLSVRNVGSIPALDVRVFDRVPDGCELMEAVPPAETVSNVLAWQLGDLQPGEERSLILKMVPQVEGELGSVARVVFESASSVRTIATRPDLKLVQRAPEQVLIGQQLEIDLELSNVGSGAAQNVLLKVDLPEGLDHVNGKQIESPVGLMSPGDKRRQLLRLRATRPGLITNTIWLVDADGLKVPSTVEIEVIAPNVELALDGPSLRYLERQATYQVQIGNAGTADATNLEIAAFLDKGLKFVSTESSGQYDAGRHAVFWSLEELPAGQAGTVALTLLPVEPGAQEVRLEAHGDLGITATSEKELTIETLAELNFTITDDQDPIETGAVATYVVRVQNSGTRDDTNVRLEVQLPHPAIELMGSTPAAQTDGLGRVVFEPIARIPAKGEQVYKIQVKGNLPDTHLIKAILLSDQSKKPVTKEESTTVYSDK